MDTFYASLPTLTAFEGILDRATYRALPDDWLIAAAPFDSGEHHRDAYVQYLQRRLQSPHAFAEEAIRARSLV